MTRPCADAATAGNLIADDRVVETPRNYHRVGRARLQR